MNHVMIDLETLGVRPGSVVTQIGAVWFDPLRPLELGPKLELFLPVEEQTEAGLTVDASTLEWWMMQGGTARRHLFGPPAVRRCRTVAEGLNALRAYLAAPPSDGGLQGVWSHGAAADIAWLNDLLKVMKSEPLFDYRLVRDTRTIYSLVGGAPEPLTRGVPHRAVDDAVDQATQVQASYLALRNAFLGAMDLGYEAAAEPGPVFKAIGIGVGEVEDYEVQQAHREPPLGLDAGGALEAP